MGISRGHDGRRQGELSSRGEGFAERSPRTSYFSSVFMLYLSCHSHSSFFSSVICERNARTLQDHENDTSSELSNDDGHSHTRFLYLRRGGRPTLRRPTDDADRIVAQISSILDIQAPKARCRAAAKSPSVAPLRPDARIGRHRVLHGFYMGR